MAPAAVKKALQAEREARRGAVAAAEAAGADEAEREAAALPACAAGDPFHHHHLHTSPQAAALDAAAAAEAAAVAAAAASSASHHHHHHNGDVEGGNGTISKSSSKKLAAAVDHDDEAPITLCHHNHGGHGHGHHHHHHDHDHHDHDHDEADTDYHHASQHTHQCLRSSNAQRWQLASSTTPDAAAATARAAALRKVKLTVGAYAMELGCIFHSVIIGVGLGVVVSGRAYVATLLGALTVHQALEGLSLGSVLARTGFSRLHQSIMVLTYSLTTPLGIAIGIAVTGAYDPASKTALAVQGALNGLSGGMLLHIALFQIVAEEFSREDLLARPKLRLGLYTSLLLGAALMCILAIWA
jgi:zinc transporter 1/2/3